MKRLYEMPFGKRPKHVTRCFAESLCEVDGNAAILGRISKREIARDGPFRPPYYYADKIEGASEGSDGYVFCPGPSLDDVDLRPFVNKLVFAVNSAFFKLQKVIRSAIWVFFECKYVAWIPAHKIERRFRAMGPTRVASRLRARGMTSRLKRFDICQFEERRNMPFFTPAVSTIGAIAACWWMGCRRVFLIGCDLDYQGDKPYANVPHATEWTRDPAGIMRQQVIDLNKISFPGLKIYNTSERSRSRLEFDFVDVGSLSL